MLFVFAKCCARYSDLVVNDYVAAEFINNIGILDQLLARCIASIGSFLTAGHLRIADWFCSEPQGQLWPTYCLLPLA